MANITATGSLTPNKVRVIYWQMTGDKAAAANWLRHTAKPEFANNHFLQGQWRNIARAQILLGEFGPAEIVLEDSMKMPAVCG